MKKILFFDDEPFVMSYLIKCLMENLEWSGDKELVFVSTIQDLLTEINSIKEVYDLFVLDVMAPMPSDKLEEYFSKKEWIKMDGGMNAGIVLAEKIRKIEKYKNVPILFLSARSISTIPDSENPNTVYIRKPVSSAEITKKINELLGTNK